LQMLLIEAASPESGLALCRALSSFHAQLDTDEEGRCFVRVELGNDRRSLEVFAALDVFVKTRVTETAKSMTVSVDEHLLPRKTDI
jgi:hypothetical protein